QHLFLFGAHQTYLLAFRVPARCDPSSLSTATRARSSQKHGMGGQPVFEESSKQPTLWLDNARELVSQPRCPGARWNVGLRTCPIAERGFTRCQSCLFAAFGRPGRARQVEGGVDQADVRERLREVTDHPPRLRVVFLRQ